MRRRSSLVSQLISSSKSSLLLNQVKSSYGLKIWEAFSTEVFKQADGGTFPKEKTPFITFVLGGPGSGKGTQCSKIVETFGFTHLSAGDLLRKEISSNSENGSMILSTIKKGKIVPSEVTIKLIQRAIESTENDKFLIDGFPRTEANRIAYERIVSSLWFMETLSSFCPCTVCSKGSAAKINLKPKNLKLLVSSYCCCRIVTIRMFVQIGAEPNIVLFFDCPEEEMVKRVLSRNEGRVDDNIDTVKERLKVFRSLNLPVINYYSEKGILYKVIVMGSGNHLRADQWYRNRS